LSEKGQIDCVQFNLAKSKVSREQIARNSIALHRQSLQ
jgi:hypothetical protein